MLTEGPARDGPVPLARLTAASNGRNRYDALDFDTPIDSARWFFAESLTPLFYTRVYGELSVDDRRRYNQLTGLLANEVILFLESEILAAVLRAVSRTRPVRADADLLAALEGFGLEESVHADVWRRLNRLCEPSWYARSSYHLLRVSPAVAWTARSVARHPTAFPVVLWLQLAQEERSVEMSRRCLLEPPGRLEPRFAAAYRLHLHDEVRHVQLDWHLIDRLYRGRSAIVRRATAALFERLVSTVFLAPVYSTTRIVSVLAAERPHLGELVPAMLRELRALTGSDAYQRMMYSRSTTPVTFELFDRYPEFQPLGRVLRSYETAATRAS